MEIGSFAVPYEYFNKIDKRTQHNDILSDYYARLYEETNDEIHNNRSTSVRLCGKYMDFDYYRLQGVKELKRINLCRDKFCSNCQALLAAQRLHKYTPVLNGYAEEYDLYHVVFTLPNCTAEELRPTLDLMYKKFGYMTRYLRGVKKIKGIDFTLYGYQGAVRSLEVTQNFNTGTFHPHFHCIFILAKGLNLEKCHINQYSFDGDKLINEFSDFEILLQKVWRLVLEGKKVKKSSLDELKQGFSVKADLLKDGDYKEVFKYAVKGCLKDGKLYDYESFKTLYYALYGRRIIQGYGVLHSLKFEDDEIIEDETDTEYDALIGTLQALEKPVFTYESLNEVLLETLRCNVVYISKSNFRRVLAESECDNFGTSTPVQGATIGRYVRRE